MNAIDEAMYQAFARPFAYLIAPQIDAYGCYSENGIAQIDEIALASKIDMKAKWQPSIGFFESVSKPTLFKLLHEQCGTALRIIVPA